MNEAVAPKVSCLSHLIQRYGRIKRWCRHLVGMHDSHCRMAGSWLLSSDFSKQRQLRGPFCSVSNMPLILKSNKNFTKGK
jgi:hypothetical protein